MAKQVFNVPTGCRKAMTDLHNAHTDRFKKVVRKLNQMKVNEFEDHRLLATFVDTHNVLRDALGKLQKHTADVSGEHGIEIPQGVENSTNAAMNYADDIRRSLIGDVKVAVQTKKQKEQMAKLGIEKFKTLVPRRGKNVGSEHYLGTPVGDGEIKAHQRVDDPQDHLLGVYAALRQRRETAAERKRDEGEVPYHLLPISGPRPPMPNLSGPTEPSSKKKVNQ